MVRNYKAFVEDWGDSEVEAYSETPGVVDKLGNVTPPAVGHKEEKCEKTSTPRENKN